MHPAPQALKLSALVPCHNGLKQQHPLIGTQQLQGPFD